MFRLQRSLCLTRIISSQLIRTLPRSAAPADYALINPTNPSPNVVFNDYKLTTKQSAPKLPDIQTGLNKYLLDCDEHSLLLTLESKYKLFDSNLVAIFIQRLHDLNIKRDSNERHHQRLYDFVDYLILKHGPQFDYEHVLTIFYQLASLNGTTTINLNYAIKALIQLLKHNVNKYHLDQTGRILIALENDLGCQIHNDERIRPLFDGLLLLTKFRQKELDRLDAKSLAELAYSFASELDHIYFTDILTEYLHDEYHHDKYSTMLIFRALDRRNYKHNRTLDRCLYYVNANKDLFTNEIDEIKRILTKLEYHIDDE